MDWDEITAALKKFWNFLWYDDSALSWVVNIILAFVIIKFLVYPGLGFALNTPYPVVAVVSESMEHSGQPFEAWWGNTAEKYEAFNITKEEFREFRFRNGFNKGDIMVVYGKDYEDIHVGETLIFDSNRPAPIIHRVIRTWQEDGVYYYQTKGDNNAESISNPSVDEVQIHQQRVIGVAVARIPLLGYIKIIAVRFLGLFGINFTY